LQPIKKLAAFLNERKILFHSDAVQAVGHMNVDVCDLGVDLLSMSAHKINGPKGIGFLYINDDTVVSSQQHGGEQEKKRRPGTENVAGIVGLAEAVKISNKMLEKH